MYAVHLLSVLLDFFLQILSSVVTGFQI